MEYLIYTCMCVCLYIYIYICIYKFTINKPPKWCCISVLVQLAQLLHHLALEDLRLDKQKSCKPSKPSIFLPLLCCHSSSQNEDGGPPCGWWVSVVYVD